MEIKIKMPNCVGYKTHLSILITFSHIYNNLCILYTLKYLQYNYLHYNT